MSASLEPYCLGDPLHFSAPQRWSPAWDRPLSVPGGFDDPAWSTREFGVWRVHEHLDAPCVEQGWKIHISTTVAAAERVVALVGEHCRPLRLPWKHATSLAMVASANSRSCHRASSGKSIVVYPPDTDAFLASADALAALLRGEEGPYVLSDRRWADDAPVYFRYGAFLPRQTWTDDGRRVPARRAGSGEGAAVRMVEDDRRVPYRDPVDVEVPDQVRRRTAPQALPPDLPVVITEAVQHSGCGGVYRGRLRADGSSVVVKEARPHTGGTPTMPDAIERLRHEARVLDELGGTVTPALRTTFTLDGHLFLVADEIPGQNLRHWVAANHPQLTALPTRASLDAYAQMCRCIADSLDRAIAVLHDSGWAHNDIHPGNVIVGPDLSARIADLEFATRPDSLERPGMDCAGFARAHGSARERDQFGLMMIRAWLLHPGIGPLVELSPETLVDHAEVATEWFEGAAEPVRHAAAAYAQDGRRAPVAERTGHVIGPPAGDVTVAALLAYHHAVARPDEAVLFPGHADAYSSDVGALSLAHGAAGVLLAHLEAGDALRPEWVEHFARATDRCSTPLASPGLWDGWTGVALAWAILGDDARTALALGRARDALAGCTDPTLWSGATGCALGFLRIAQLTGDEAPRLDALRMLEAIAQDPAGWAARARVPGLLHGPSGGAAVLALTAQELGSARWLDACQELVDTDLARCARGATGTLDLTAGGVSLPYLGHGSIGLALARRTVARAHARSTDLTDEALLRAGMVDLMVEPGLVHGRLGVAYGLARLGSQDDSAEARRWAALHLRRLRVYAVAVGDGAGIVGRGGGRLSADLATGSAGALLMLAGGERGTPLLDLLLGQALPEPTALRQPPTPQMSVAHHWSASDAIAPTSEERRSPWLFSSSRPSRPSRPKPRSAGRP